MEADSQTPDNAAARDDVPARMFANLRIVSLGTLLSRILGMARDMAMASLFGAGTTLDAFIVAFRIPNLTRQLFGEGALTTAFLPVFIQDRIERGPEAARATLTAVAVVLATILSGIVLLGEAVCLSVGLLIPLSEPNFLLLCLFMVMLPYLALICLAALCCAALHALRQFAWPALVPVILNVVWLLGLALAWKAGNGETQRSVFVAASVTFAGILQLLLPAVILQRQRQGFVREWRSAWPRMATVFRTMLPVVGGIAVLQLSSVLDSVLSWVLARPEFGEPAWIERFGIPPVLESGTASALYIGQRMYQFPLGILGVALGTVLYPILTQHAQRGDWHLLRADLSRGLRLVVAIGIPAGVGLVVLAAPMTSALFQRGNFDRDDAALAARMIAIYGSGVWAFIGLAILNRAFYATGDRMTPMRLGFAAVALNLAVNLLLVGWLGGTALALGTVVAALFQAALTLSRLNRRVGPLEWPSILTTLVKTLLASTALAAAALGTLAALPDESVTLTGKLQALLLPMGTGTAVFLLSARFLRIPEVFELFHGSSRH